MRNSMPRRGLHSMQTRASRKAIASLETPELYLKLTSLEIERSRRANELENLLERINKLQNRINTIVGEQEELQRRIAAQQGTVPQDVLTASNSNPSMGFTY
jgi:chromosome segregation ATPase